jgi:putative transposase
MIQHYTFNYRLYPTKKQSVLLDKHFGCTRFVFNYYLNKEQQHYLNNKEDIEAKRVKGFLNYYDNCKDLTNLKQEEPWLKEVNSQTLQATLKNLESAYRGFFQKRSKFPRFKSKKSRQSFCIPQHLSIKNNRLYIPKFQEGIKINLHRDLVGEFVTASIVKTKTGKYFVNITVELDIKELPKINTDIGIDFGIKNFLITSNGEVFDNKHFYKKVESKLKYLQRQASKKVKGSQNRRKANLKVAELFEYITNCKKDYLHKVSIQLIRENQTIYIENLNIKGMLSNHHLAKSIQEMSWYEFVRQLEYKAKWYGRSIVKIDRFYPSSKTCNNCGYIKQDLTLKDRNWVCPKCHTEIDRDYNVALNILKQGRNCLVKPTELS